MQEAKTLSKAEKAVFWRLVRHGGLADMWLLDTAEVVEAFYSSLAAGHIGSEFLGQNGKPGLIWPTLETFDGNFLSLKSAPHKTPNHPPARLTSHASI